MTLIQSNPVARMAASYSNINRMIRLLPATLFFLLLVACDTAEETAQKPAAPTPVRIATFNIEMGLPEPGQMGVALMSG